MHTDFFKMKMVNRKSDKNQGDNFFKTR